MLDKILIDATADTILNDETFDCLFSYEGFEFEKAKVKLSKKAADLRVGKHFEKLLQAHYKQRAVDGTLPHWQTKIINPRTNHTIKKRPSKRAFFSDTCPKILYIKGNFLQLLSTAYTTPCP
jgi:hypothetical protein